MVKVKEKKNEIETEERVTLNKPAKIKGMNKHENDKNDENIYFMALGGLEHVGQNMYLYKYKGKYLVVDCGMGFLEEEIGAGDVQYCDTTWLEKYKDDVIGFVINSFAPARMVFMIVSVEVLFEIATIFALLLTLFSSEITSIAFSSLSLISITAMHSFFAA